MKIKINKGIANGCVLAPPSKSYAHRLLIAAGLSEGNSIVSNVELSNDIKATINCLKALNKTIEYNEVNKCVYVSNTNNSLDDVIYMDAHESGSTFRFLIPIGLLTGKKIVMSGTERLIERGIGEYEKIFKDINILVEKTKDNITFTGKLKPGVFSLQGNISSQFITGLLFALPLLEKDSLIKLTTSLESQNYVDITIDVLKKAGIVIHPTFDGYYIPGNQKYKPINLSVEGDHSNAAFLDSFNYLNGNVELSGLNSNSFQGDKIYKEYFNKIKEGYPTLDISNCIDLGPILFCMASLHNGAHFIKTSRLKIKESNRIEAVKLELEKFGASIIELEDEVIVEKKKLHTPICELYGQNDHRVVMSMAVMSSVYGGIISNAEAVKKSFPNFFEVLKQLGLEVEEIYE